MTIFGIDFTSTPTRRKPITLAVGQFKGDVLNISTVETLPSFDEFELCLQQRGPWTAGLDFPFGLPHAFVLDQGWKPEWPHYVETVSKMSYAAFTARIRDYKAKKPTGFKDPLRYTDFGAGSQSPLKLINAPVARMFYEGAPRLLKSSASIPPVRPRNAPRTLLEAYPGFLARLFVKSYKTEQKKSDTPARKKARREIIEKIQSPALAFRYGFEVRMKGELGALLQDDHTGDRLDAALCAVQAGWAFREGRPRWGIQNGGRAVVQSEGWIIDPSL